MKNKEKKNKNDDTLDVFSVQNQLSWFCGGAPGEGKVPLSSVSSERHHSALAATFGVHPPQIHNQQSPSKVL